MRLCGRPPAAFRGAHPPAIPVRPEGDVAARRAGEDLLLLLVQSLPRHVALHQPDRFHERGQGGGGVLRVPDPDDPVPVWVCGVFAFRLHHGFRPDPMHGGRGARCHPIIFAEGHGFYSFIFSQAGAAPEKDAADRRRRRGRADPARADREPASPCGGGGPAGRQRREGGKIHPRGARAGDRRSDRGDRRGFRRDSHHLPVGYGCADEADRGGVRADGETL